MSNSVTKQNKELIICAVTDNKPGHHNQSEGLIQALSNYRHATVTWIPVTSISRAIWILLTKRCSNFSKQKPDLLIGSGHHTHLLLLALRWCFGGRIVIMMSPSLSLNLFDLCLIPRHDQPKNADNIIETRGAINRIVPASISKKKLLKDSGLILIGGPSKHFSWDSIEVLRQIESLVSNKPNIKWTLAGSRRTPAELYNNIKVKLPTVKTILADEVSQQWLPEQMQKSGQVWVTEDSISMIYEALTSGAKTGIVRLTHEKPTRVTEEIERLLVEGRVNTMSSENDDNKKITLFEADRCAKLLLEKFNL